MSDEITSQYQSLRRTYDDFEDGIRLSSVSSSVNDISDSINKLPDEIKEIRDRGYIFASYLENKAEVLRNHWDEIRDRVQSAMDDEMRTLRQDFAELERDVEKADKVEDIPEKLERILPDIESGLERLQAKIDAASSHVQDIYSTLENDLNQMNAQLRDIKWYLEQKEEASFDFLANENIFLAAKAEWVQTDKGKKDPDGIMFLTDQRMVFEQKEKTGKRLGMFGGKMEQEVEWEVQLNQVEEVEAEKKGMFGGKDMLNFKLGSGAPFADLAVEVKGGVDCRFWAKQVERMIKGETTDERAIEPDPEMLESIRNAPTACHVCGATLPKLVANQTQIECQYCGSVIRI